MDNNTIFRKYIKAEGKEVTHLKVEMYYSLGGYNYFTYREDPRGYYLSVTPVERSDRGGYITESTTLFHGVKTLLMEVKRKSQAAAKEAARICDSRIEELINAVCVSENIKLVEEIKAR